MLGAALIGWLGTEATMATIAGLAVVNIGLMVALWRLSRR
jgi:hypothetical protein